MESLPRAMAEEEPRAHFYTPWMPNPNNPCEFVKIGSDSAGEKNTGWDHVEGGNVCYPGDADALGPHSRETR